MAAPPTAALGLLAKTGAYVRMGEIRQFFRHIKPSDTEGQELLKTFLAALHSPDVSIDAAAHATRQLQKWVEQGLTKAEAKEFKIQTGTMFREATYGRAATDVRLGKYAADIPLEDVKLPNGIWAAVKSHLDDLNPAGDLRAFHAFERMLGALGSQDEGWAKLMRYLAKYDKDTLIKEAERLNSTLKLLEGAKGAKRMALLKEIESAKGIQSGIKGLLGEIYLARWPTLRAEVDKALVQASEVAAAMGEGWEAMHVVGNIKIDGKDAYDQAVILVNLEKQKVVIHTAVQMKVERKLSAFHQIERDVSRERRLKRPKKAVPDAPAPAITPAVNMAPSAGQFEVKGYEGQLKGFSFQALPDGMATQRYVYFAEGPKLGLANDRKLKALGVEAKAMPIDLSVESLNALALQIMLSAKKMK